MQKIAILGAAGDANVVAEAIRQTNEVRPAWELVGFFDDDVKSWSPYGPVLGALEDWPTLHEEVLLIPALHRYGKMRERWTLLNNLNVPAERWASVIHPMSAIGQDVTIGFGSFVASFVTIQPGTRVGNFTSIRGGANIGHDSSLGPFCYVGPNSTTCGKSRVGTGGHLGPNSVLLGNKSVGEFGLVGIGSVVLSDVLDEQTVGGNPARPLRLSLDSSDADNFPEGDH